MQGSVGSVNSFPHPLLAHFGMIGSCGFCGAFEDFAGLESMFFWQFCGDRGNS